MEQAGRILAVSFSRAILGIVLAVLAALAAPPVRAESGNFFVVANDRKADGKPWRGSGDVFLNLPGTPVTTTGQTKNAPSLVLCTLAADGSVACPGSKGRDARGRLASPCHLSRDCEFDDIDLPDGDAFGVIVISPAIIYTNLVDALVFSRRKMNTKDPVYQSLNAMLHEAAERLAPSGSEDELRRRDRPFPLKSLQDCAVAACTLRQSDLKLEVP